MTVHDAQLDTVVGHAPPLQVDDFFVGFFFRTSLVPD
jgi:hypothetical protein